MNKSQIKIIISRYFKSHVHPLMDTQVLTIMFLFENSNMFVLSTLVYFITFYNISRNRIMFYYILFIQLIFQ